MLGSGIFALGPAYRLHQLEKYLDISEKQLQKAKTDFEAWAGEQEKKLSPEERDNFYDFYTDVYWQYAEGFPRMLRNSFLVSCFSLLEREMAYICRRLKRDRQIAISWSDLRRDVDVLGRAKLYFKLSELPLSYDDATWQELKRYYKVRNCIVHWNGLVKELEADQDFIAYVTRKGILSEDTIEREIALTEQFCREVIRAMRDFLLRVYEAYELCRQKKKLAEAEKQGQS